MVLVIIGQLSLDFEAAALKIGGLVIDSVVDELIFVTLVGTV